MTSRTQNRRVMVFNFGQHAGTVIGAGDYTNWLRILLDDGREWHGHRKLTRRLSPKTIAAHAEYQTIA